MQACDIQVRDGVQNMNSSGVLNAKTSATTARNGSSFLAIIEKMIHGAKDGKEISDPVISSKKTARGAGNIRVPGEKDTLTKQVSELLTKQTGKIHIESTDKKAVVKEPEKLILKTGSLKTEAQKKEEKKTGFEDELYAVSVNATIGSHSQKQTEVNLAQDQLSDEDNLREMSALDFKAETDNKGSTYETSLFSTPDLVNKKGLDKDSAANTETRAKKAIIGVKHGRAKEAREENVEKIAAGSTLVEKIIDNGDGTADMSIAFKSVDNHSSSSDAVLPNSTKGNEAGQSFASMLSSELRENAADFVKTGQIILRENNTGLIRLSLNPASLGNVRISLELSDRKISGRIIVDSEEAYKAFNESLDSLSEAFVEGGFSSAGFDLSWSGNNPSESSQNEQQGILSSPFYASSIPDVMSQLNSSDTINNGYYQQNGYAVVNVLA